VLKIRNSYYYFSRKEDNMDQAKIGEFLKELRKEKGLSQEQLAEEFNVSSRSISRWENGNTMPDISIIIELADFYDVDIRELLNGERKSEKMDKELKETLEMVAEYTKAEREKLMKQLITMVTASAVFFIILGLIVVLHLNRVHNCFDALACYCAAIGTAYSIMSVIRLRQLNGKMNKASYKKTVIILLIIGVVVMILAILGILLAAGFIG
jgi:transcriptional regulator with XRE-family HTH domain